MLIKPGQQSPETREFAPSTWLPRLARLARRRLGDRRSPLNLSLLLALVAGALVWFYVWHTRWGYELRALGHNETAAVYAGISPARTIIVAMSISGGLAGLMSLNEVMGVQHRLLMNFPGGAGYVGIAVALMGRNHPVGIVPAAILFGALYQGGSELSFDMPTLTRDMVVVIQGLIILVCGALEHALRPAARRAVPAAPRRRRERRACLLDRRLLAAATARGAAPLVLAALGGLFAERSGIVDIGLEGKMLASAFAAAATAAVTGSAWVGLGAGIAASVLAGAGARLRLHHPPRQPGGLGHGAQHHAVGAHRGARARLVPAGRPDAAARPPARASRPIELPGAAALAGVPGLGPIYREVVSGHNVLVYVAAAAVPVVAWLVYRTRFGLRLRAVGESPGAVDTAGISVAALRYRALIVSGVLCGLSGAYLSIAHNAAFIRDMSAGKGYLALAALIFGQWRPVPDARRLPALRLRRRGCRRAFRARRCPSSAWCPCSSSRRCPTCSPSRCSPASSAARSRPRAIGVP